MTIFPMLTGSMFHAATNTSMRCYAELTQTCKLMFSPRGTLYETLVILDSQKTIIYTKGLLQRISRMCGAIQRFMVGFEM